MKRVLAIMGMLVALAGCSSGQDDAATSGLSIFEGSATELVQLLGQTDADYVTFGSTKELADQADVVVVGTLTHPKLGREISGSPGDPLPALRMVQFDLQNVEVLGGPNPAVLQQRYAVEMMLPAVEDTAGAITSIKSATQLGQRALMFLSTYDLDPSTTTVRGGEDGIVYLDPSMQGTYFESEDGSALVAEAPLPGSDDHNFEALISRVRTEIG